MVGGRRLEVGGWLSEAGGWRFEAVGGRLEAVCGRRSDFEGPASLPPWLWKQGVGGLELKVGAWKWEVGC